MKYYSVLGLILTLLLAGCATTKASDPKVAVWEAKEIPGTYDVVGPVSVSEQIAENAEDTAQGLAGLISKDGRITGQVPPEMQAVLDAKREKYKEMIFEKLGAKAKPYGADAVIDAVYSYVPAYATFSPKASVSAKGMMVKYKT